ncbi:hypothetical protein AUQ37_02660 [Candidatus Methanomethylophilus sp. 1R26]|uniref:hypothetical protein n=1 Tax=Candidatus Methanomethylophilus sp. 1R26 TaxID=1769296 RepID=UPI000736013B|nr:hypothetical protein [Candidatus Methanomethylophilus sp. 1R26]KUE73347.1 hypothetical protein AUQ37_02660 [Candidatus Methanomethylophilus sp. 1R26]
MTGKIGKIPTDSTGHVPEKALIKRYSDFYREKQREYDLDRMRSGIMGKRKPAVDLAKLDYSRTSDRVIPLRCTPEQVAAWYADPSSCDVEDIDCAGAPKTNVPKGMTEAQKRDQGKIRVIATPLEEQMFRRELVMGFSPADVSRIAESRPTVQIGYAPAHATGAYCPGRNRVSIDRRNGMNQGTVVHELSHELRATDPSRRSPVVRANPSASIEESCTVAEQQARSDGVDYNGYYAMVPVFDERTRRWRRPTRGEAMRMAEEDHALFTEGRRRGLKDGEAVRSVEDHWEDSHIARLRCRGHKMAINEMADTVGGVERVSRAKPRTEAERKEQAVVPVTNATAGRPGVAMANVSAKRGPLISRAGTGAIKGRTGGRKSRTEVRRYLVMIDESGTPSYSGSQKEFTLTASINSNPDAWSESLTVSRRARVIRINLQQRMS